MKTVTLSDLQKLKSEGVEVERDIQVDGLKELTSTIGDMVSSQVEQTRLLTSSLTSLKSKDSDIAKLFLNIQHLITSNNQVNKNLENLIILSRLKSVEDRKPVIEMKINRDKERAEKWVKALAVTVVLSFSLIGAYHIILV